MNPVLATFHDYSFWRNESPTLTTDGYFWELKAANFSLTTGGDPLTLMVTRDQALKTLETWERHRAYNEREAKAFFNAERHAYTRFPKANINDLSAVCD